MWSVSPKAAHADAGFSLIEALVALAVFATAGVALVMMHTQSVRAEAALEAKAFGNLVAQNLLVEAAAAQAAPPLGVSEGETNLAGVAWRWRQEVAATLDPQTRRVRVVVRGVDRSAVAADLTAFIAAPSESTTVTP